VPNGPDREALVIRLRPIADPAAVLRAAERAYRDHGHHHLSVFADIARGAESEEDLINRLLDAAELSNILRSNNPKFWFCQRAGELLDDGFVFVKNEYDGEASEHWSIDLGNAPSLQDTERLAAHFPESRRWTS
jgi:hypothetical protein